MLKLAWRNLWRNRGRTLIMVGAIAFSMGLLFVQIGLADDMHAKMELSAVKTAGGNVLVHGEGYWESQSSDAVIEDPEPIMAAANSLEHVETVIPRVHIMGLLTSPRGSSGARLTGIDKDLEAQLQDLEPFVVEGTFLAEGEERPLVLGKELVEELEVDLGDRIVLTTTAPDGEVVRALFFLSGVLETGISAMDSSAAYTTLDTAQDAILLDDGLTQVALLLDDDENRAQVKSELLAKLADDGVQTDALEVLTWDEAIPEMVGFIELDAAYNYLFGLVVFIIVAFGIANTFLMAVMERIRELGLLGAIGLTPGRIARLVLTETLLLAVVSIGLGFGLGLLGHLYLSNAGLDLADIYDVEMDISGVTFTDTEIGSVIIWTKWLTAAALVAVLVILSSLYPAWRASRLDPAQAMRTFE